MDLSDELSAVYKDESVLAVTPELLSDVGTGLFKSKTIARK